MVANIYQLPAKNQFPESARTTYTHFSGWTYDTSQNFTVAANNGLQRLVSTLQRIWELLLSHIYTATSDVLRFLYRHLFLGLR